MARPKNTAPLRNKGVTFRLTEQEYFQYVKQLDKSRSKSGEKYTASDFFRDILFKNEVPKSVYLRKIKEPTECDILRIRSFSNTMNNINQLAKHANTLHNNGDKIQLLKTLENLNFLAEETKDILYPKNHEKRL
jgi:hypothetical protein